ncbi:menaquinone-dependent protoporphyrinogen IX dehydrogenase [Conservatibacter flavescens]|uniref:Protoporphyrinogen IX dehydrogenase [quinone] n=1 Tax=Conservatibacter flavescens TaxID=28161 RepID=A0A2M8RZD5_9PAST|nr:menaquinone-dependent protoporphyrinogen IX dehydrogenase [Conservatibacter flavescens]PJG84251.1 menaquinone-dependent protoporphyrinogen IX dehydrogenase [Conservatibacter flavescens]
MKTLILYLSHDGQTMKIAHEIACKMGGVVEVAPLNPESAVDLKQFSQVVIGASIRYGHFHRNLYQFIEKYHLQLNQMPTAFFSVNLTARKADKNTPETNGYTRKFLQKSKWKPTITQVFAGGLYYPRYRFIDRVMIQLIMRITGGETDTTKEIEYTNWNDVYQFADRLKHQVNRA